MLGGHGDLAGPQAGVPPLRRRRPHARRCPDLGRTTLKEGEPLIRPVMRGGRRLEPMLPPLADFTHSRHGRSRSTAPRPSALPEGGAAVSGPGCTCPDRAGAPGRRAHRMTQEGGRVDTARLARGHGVARTGSVRERRIAESDEPRGNCPCASGPGLVPASARASGARADAYLARVPRWSRTSTSSRRPCASPSSSTFSTPALRHRFLRGRSAAEPAAVPIGLPGRCANHARGRRPPAAGRERRRRRSCGLDAAASCRSDAREPDHARERRPSR